MKIKAAVIFETGGISRLRNWNWMSRGMTKYWSASSLRVSVIPTWVPGPDTCPSRSRRASSGTKGPASWRRSGRGSPVRPPPEDCQKQNAPPGGVGRLGSWGSYSINLPLEGRTGDPRRTRTCSQGIKSPLLYLLS
jgi:hypothetical protein